MVRRVRTLLRSDTRSAELVSAAVLGLVWGAWLLLPFHTFSTASAFRVMAMVAYENVWGVVLFIVSFAQSGSLCFDTRQGRFWAASAAGSFYAFIATMLLIANPLGTGWLTYSLLAFANVWAVLRLARLKA